MEQSEKLSKRERKKLNREEKKSKEQSSGMKNKLVVVAGIIAVAAGAFWLMYRSGTSAPDLPEVADRLTTEVTAEDNVYGPEDAIVTLVSYEDFQCPACAAYHPIVEQMAGEFADDLRIVQRHFPLRSIHRHAQIASQAAEAAAQQGKFWPMTSLLFTRQSVWGSIRDPRSTFLEYAQELELDVAAFETYMNSDEARDKVNSDYESGIAMGVNSTPTFFLNGQRIQNPQGYDAFRQLIQAEIDKAMAQAPANGTEEESVENDTEVVDQEASEESEIADETEEELPAGI